MKTTSAIEAKQAAMRARMARARSQRHRRESIPMTLRRGRPPKPKRIPLDPTKEQKRLRARLWMRMRRDDWFRTAGPCVDCGSTEYLEIDHNNPAQKVSHRVWSWSEARRSAELAKCSVRCRPCHQKRHATAPANHGTTTRYRSGCRCAECRRANTNQRRSWRASRH